MNDDVDQRGEIERLLEFLRERDAACPRCGYNLRNLTQPACPECNAELMLKVGLQRVIVHWLLLTPAPSMFCGLAMAAFLAMSAIHGFPGGFPLEAVLTLGFLTTSGIVGLVLTLAHRWFLRQHEIVQMAWAGATWLIHVSAFLVLALYI